MQLQSVEHGARLNHPLEGRGRVGNKRLGFRDATVCRKAGRRNHSSDYR